MKRTFVTLGHQLRVVDRDIASLCGSVAENVNPLYLPLDRKLAEDYASSLMQLQIPFMVASDEELLRMCSIASEDVRHTKKIVAVFSCSISFDDYNNAKFSYFTREQVLVTVPYASVQRVQSTCLSCRPLGLDVLDASEGGGFDSAMHTYGLGLESLNKFGLIEDANTAYSIREKADLETDGHGPFSVWEIGVADLADALAQLGRVNSVEP